MCGVTLQYINNRIHWHTLPLKKKVKIILKILQYRMATLMLKSTIFVTSLFVWNQSCPFVLCEEYVQRDSLVNSDNGENKKLDIFIVGRMIPCFRIVKFWKLNLFVRARSCLYHVTLPGNTMACLCVNECTQFIF